MASSACWEVLEVLEEGQVPTDPQTALPLLGTPAELARPPRLELPPILETVDLPTPEGSEQANSRRQEDLAVLVGSLIWDPGSAASLHPTSGRTDRLALALRASGSRRPGLATTTTLAKRPQAAIAGAVGHVAAHHGHLL